MNLRISVVTCTFNGARILGMCLQSIMSQDYPDMEVLIVDGGSADKTCDIARDFACRHPKLAFKFLENQNRLPEGHGNGKWLGYSQATGEIIAFIDQDNVLQRPDLFASAAERLRTRPVLGVLGGVTHDPTDLPVVRYAALFGTDSFFAYRSLDNLRTDKLTSLYGEAEYQEYSMSRDNMLLTGGNCFFYRKDDLREIGGYSQDVLVVNKLLDRYCAVGVIPSATKHHAERSMMGLVMKKFKWGQTYFRGGQERFKYLPHTPKEFIFFVKNLMFTLSIVLNIYYAVRIFIKSRDMVSFLYPVIGFLNTIAYGYSILQATFKRIRL